jgi:hypothetical protein
MSPNGDEPKGPEKKQDLDVISELIDADLDEVAAGHYSIHFSAPQ